MTITTYEYEYLAGRHDAVLSERDDHARTCTEPTGTCRECFMLHQTLVVASDRLRAADAAINAELESRRDATVTRLRLDDLFTQSLWMAFSPVLKKF